MARKIATVKATGGFGFQFADTVAAVCLVRMLDGKPVFGLWEYRPLEISFETRVSGWLLDDLLLKLEGASGIAKCGVSIKSSSYLSTTGFKSDFVGDVWEQWGNAGATPFDPARDYLALAVGELVETAGKAWRDIEKRLPSADPLHLKDRLKTARSSSEVERKIFKSLLPEARKKEGLTEDDAARLLRRLRVQYFSEQTDADAVSDCIALLVAGDEKQGSLLWQRLLKIASDLRVDGGTLKIEGLIGKLRGDFALREHPHYAGAWELLNQHSHGNCAAVHARIGVSTHISFDGLASNLIGQCKADSAAVILGESGVGKSSLLKEYVLSTSRDRNLIWLTDDQLDAPNQTVLARQLGLAFELPILVQNSTRPVLLVLDAIDLFPTRALQRLNEIVGALLTSGSPTFQVMMTAQPLRWSDMKREVQSWALQGVTESPFAGPDFAQISSALASNAQIVPLFHRPELRKVVMNLATLDQIVKFASTPRALADRQWIGETEVIDWVWESWTGHDQRRHQRGALLRELGELDAEVGSSIPISRVPRDFLVPLDDPRITALSRADSRVVRFRHELVADWARYAVLKAAGQPVLESIRGFIHNPRWMRAIRLYAQSLLEEAGGLSAWDEVFASFELKESGDQVAADVVSDSLIFATNSKELLERVWPALIKDKGRRLKRLIKRMLLIATVPLKVNELGEEYSDAAAVVMRFPIPIYWDGFLEVLAEHSDDVLTHSLGEAGELCAFYLRMMPIGWGKRHLVGRLAIKLAEEVKEDLEDRPFSHGDGQRMVMEAFLRAGSEYPDEVVELARSFAQRTDSPEENEEVRILNTTGFSAMHFGRLREPWPDGPRRRVPESFCEAALNGDAIAALMREPPAAVEELILAACIEAPQREGEVHVLDDGGFSDWDHHTPGAYFTGPFLKFLQIDALQGLSTIIKLVNFATDRWKDGFKRFHRAEPQPIYVLIMDDSEKAFSGDGNVYQWHRESRASHTAVGSALMALEKWMYDNIDARADVSATGTRILTESDSAAFLGVLVSIGLYSQGLFRGPLRPLLSSLDLYKTQRSTLLHNGDWKFLFTITWGRYGKHICGLVQSWNEMPHRQQDLLMLAQHLLLFDKDVSASLQQYRQVWMERAEAKGSLFNPDRLFFAQFDPANYTITPVGDDKVQIAFEAPDELESKLTIERRKPELFLTAMGLIAEAGGLIEGKRKFVSGQEGRVLQQLKLVENGEIQGERSDSYREEAIAGGIVILASEGREWLKSNPEALQFCLDSLKTQTETLPELAAWETAESVSDGCDTFAGIAALHFILNDHNEPWLWRCVIRALASHRYGAIEKLMSLAATHRDDPKIRFRELLAAVVLWSVIRMPSNVSGSHYEIGFVKAAQDLIMSRLHRGYLKNRKVDLVAALRLNDRYSRFKLRGTPAWEWHEQREELLEAAILEPEKPKGWKPQRTETFLDLQVLQKGFVFLGHFAVLREADALEMRGYFEQFQKLEWELIPKQLGDTTADFGTPRELDSWVMALASLYYAAGPVEEGVKAIVEPILALGSGAYHWVSGFLKNFLDHAPSLISVDARKAESWKAIIDAAKLCPAWDEEKTGSRYHLTQLWCDLFGFSGHPSRAASAGWEGALLLLEEEVIAWCDVWLKDTDAVTAFSNFVASTNTKRMRRLGLKQIAGALPHMKQRTFGQDRLTPSLIAAVSHVYKSSPEIVAPGSDVASAFREILSYLAARLVPEAIELQSRIAAG